MLSASINIATGTIAAIVFIVFLLLLLASCVKIVPQAHAYVVERLGGYQDTWSVGVHFKIPFIDRVAKKVILKEQVADFAPQPVITKDNVKDIKDITRAVVSRSPILSFSPMVLRILLWLLRI